MFPRRVLMVTSITSALLAGAACGKREARPAVSLAVEHDAGPAVEAGLPAGTDAGGEREPPPGEPDPELTAALMISLTEGGGFLVKCLSGGSSPHRVGGPGAWLDLGNRAEELRQCHVAGQITTISALSPVEADALRASEAAASGATLDGAPASIPRTSLGYSIALADTSGACPDGADAGVPLSAAASKRNPLMYRLVVFLPASIPAPFQVGEELCGHAAHSAVQEYGGRPLWDAIVTTRYGELRIAASAGGTLEVPAWRFAQGSVFARQAMSEGYFWLDADIVASHRGRTARLSRGAWEQMSSPDGVFRVGGGGYRTEGNKPVWVLRDRLWFAVVRVR